MCMLIYIFGWNKNLTACPVNYIVLPFFKEKDEEAIKMSNNNNYNQKYIIMGALDAILDAKFFKPIISICQNLSLFLHFSPFDIGGSKCNATFSVRLIG